MRPLHRDLADIDHDGQLTKEEFAVAMYLIRSKIAGKDIPQELPPSLMPPANLSDLVEQMERSERSMLMPGTPMPGMPGSTDRSNTPPPPYDENLDMS